MSKNIKALLEQNAKSNIQRHREATYSDDIDVGRQHTKIALDKIDPNPFQPRLTFPEESIRELAQSIATLGLTMPITVRAKGERYELIAGERRLRAHQLLGKPTIESIVVDADDGQSAAMALSENIDRADLSDFEIGEGIRQLEEQFPKRSHMAQALNIQRSDLYRYLSFHELPEEAITRLRANPALLGRKAASDLVQALKDNATLEGLESRLQEALDLVEAGKLEQAKIVAFLRQPALNGQGRATAPKPMILQRAGTRVGSFARTQTDVVIKVSHAALPEDKAEKLRTFLLELLEEGA